MRRILVLALLACLALAPIGAGSPIGGSTSQWPEVRDGVWPQTRPFRAGERACVLAFGSREDGANIEVTVRDAKGNVIAQDKAAGNVAAVMWYPPRDGDYAIEVRTLDNRTKIVIK